MNTSNSMEVYNWLNVAQDLPTKPTFLSKEDQALYFRLMLEELTEVAQNSPNGVKILKGEMESINWEKIEQFEPNHEGILDGLVDLEVVNHNNTVKSGLTSSYQPHFMRVMTSNLNKYCQTPQEALEGQQKYKEQGIDTWVEDKHNGFYIIKRESDNKILKGPRYKEPKTQL